MNLKFIPRTIGVESRLVNDRSIAMMNMSFNRAGSIARANSRFFWNWSTSIVAGCLAGVKNDAEGYGALISGPIAQKKNRGVVRELSCACDRRGYRSTIKD